MGFGIALGGAAKGFESAERSFLERQELSLKERTIKQDAALRERALGIQERSLSRQEQNDLLGQAETLIASNLDIIGKTIEAAKENNVPPDQIRATIAPLLSNVQRLSIGVDRDPAQYIAGVDALLTAPTAAATAASEGQAEAASKLSERDALVGAGVPEADASSAAGITKPPDLFDRMLLGAGAVPTVPPVPESLKGRGAMWSPSRQRFYTPDGVAHNQQGVPVP